MAFRPGARHVHGWKGVEDFKTHFYALEGWDKEHGWPTRKTLEDFNLKRVADSWPPRAGWELNGQAAIGT